MQARVFVALSVISVAGASSIRGAFAEWRGVPDSKELEETLKGSDPEAWGRAARKLASMAAHPLDDGWFVAYPHHSLNLVRSKLIDVLRLHLRAKDSERRAEAAEAMVGLAGAGYRGFWVDSKLANDPEPRVRAAMLRLCRLDGRKEIAPVAAKLLADSDPRVRAQAVLALTRFGPSDDMIEKLCTLTGDRAPSVRVAALRAAVALRAERAADRVIACLTDGDPAVRHAGAMAAGWLLLGDAGDQLLELMDDEGQGLVAWYSVMPGQSGWRAVEGLRHSPAARTVAGAALWALGQVGDARALPRLLKELAIEGKGEWASDDLHQWFQYPKEWRALIAADALGHLGHPSALGPLQEATRRSGVGHATREAVARLQLSHYRAIRYAPLSGPGSVRELRRWPGQLGDCPRQFVPRIFECESVSPEAFVRQAFVPRNDYQADHPLSLLADFPKVRVGALICLGRGIDSPELRGLLVRLAQEGRDPVAWGAVYVLARAGDARAKSLLRAIPASDGDARVFAGLALAELGDPRAVPILRGYLGARTLPWQSIVAHALMRMGDADAVLKLASLAETKHDDGYPQSLAFQALVQHGGEEAAYVLETYVYRGIWGAWGDAGLEGFSRLAHEGKVSRQRLVQALKGKVSQGQTELRWGYLPVVCAEHRIEEFREDLLKCLQDHDLMRTSGVTVPWALVSIGGPSILQRSLALLGNERAAVRSAAATVVGDMGDKEGLEPLVALTKDRVPDVQVAAARALGYLASSLKAESRSAAASALRRLEAASHSPRVKLEALAARTKIGDQSTIDPLRKVVADGPEWRRMIARAALTVLGEDRHLEVLRDQLAEELDRIYLDHCLRAHELIRLLGWCGHPGSLDLLDRIPTLPCADAMPYDGGQQRRNLLTACSLAKWRILRAQKRR